LLTVSGAVRPGAWRSGSMNGLRSPPPRPSPAGGGGRKARALPFCSEERSAFVSFPAQRACRVRLRNDERNALVSFPCAARLVPCVFSHASAQPGTQRACLLPLRSGGRPGWGRVGARTLSPHRHLPAPGASAFPPPENAPASLNRAPATPRSRAAGSAAWPDPPVWSGGGRSRLPWSCGDRFPGRSR
jgi:hypothetical protein